MQPPPTRPVIPELALVWLQLRRFRRPKKLSSSVFSLSSIWPQSLVNFKLNRSQPTQLEFPTQLKLQLETFDLSLQMEEDFFGLFLGRLCLLYQSTLRARPSVRDKNLKSKFQIRFEWHPLGK